MLPVSAEALTERTPGSPPRRCATALAAAGSSRNFRARTRSRPGKWEMSWSLSSAALMGLALRGGRLGLAAASRALVLRLAFCDQVFGPLRCLPDDPRHIV